MQKFYQTTQQQNKYSDF